jgi:hypothetical protein
MEGVSWPSMCSSRVRSPSEHAHAHFDGDWGSGDEASCAAAAARPLVARSSSKQSSTRRPRTVGRARDVGCITRSMDSRP